MKKLLLLASLAAVSSAPLALADDWRLERRVQQLENSVQLLQGTVSQLQFEVERLRYGQPNPRSYYCEVSAFSKIFKAYGPTEIEARNGARDACTREYHAMHCDSVKCQINQ